MTQIRVEEARIREALASMANEWTGNVDQSDEELGTPVRVMVADLLAAGGRGVDAQVLEHLIDQFAPSSQKAAAHLLAEQLGEVWESAWEAERADYPGTS